MFLLHLSDFHFGPKSRFAEIDPAELGRHFAEDLRLELSKIKANAGIDVVVVTGDLAESGTRPEFALARTFLETLAAELKLPRLRFVILPGNHDVSWNECRKVELEQADEGFPDAERERRILERKLAGFDGLLKDFYAPSLLEHLARPLEGGGWVFHFEPLGLSVAALNSCEKETHRPADRVGWVSKKQAQSLLDLWRDPALADYFKVIALHHPPVSVTDENADLWTKNAGKKGIPAELVERFVADLRGIKGSKELEILAKNTRAQLVLHGHQHAGDTKHWADGRCHVLSAGSLCLVSGELPENEPLSFRLVELQHGVAEARVWSFVYKPRNLSKTRVEKGAFRLDDAEDQPRDLPIRAPKGQAATTLPPGKLSQEQEAFLRVYRKAFEVDFAPWESSTWGVQPAGGFRRSHALLDEMYLPLRLAEGWNPQKLDQGSVLGPAMLLARKKPLLIRGQAGAGKSTWVKYTFRRLVREEGTFPLLLVLRNLALSWTPDVKGEDRSLLSYLENKIGERLAGHLPACGLRLQPLLAAEQGPRPILLVDGWDEIGAIGEDVRAKLLTLMNLHPRLLMIVTSRPYDAGGRPSHTEGFDELDVQPLDNEEIHRFSTRFFDHLHGADMARGSEEVASFERALERAEEARDLARTALLLTMMLGIHSVERLPGKRHRLYETCIRNLLADLPERKAEEGARTGNDQWRPPDSEERFQVVARLAFELQYGGYQGSERSAIVATRPMLKALLPADGQWRGNRERFLNWLVGTASLFSDRADDSLAFSHLSFQEYLAAYYLKAKPEDDERLLLLAKNLDWWETLVLWAALAGGENLERAAKMIEALLSSKTSKPELLAGVMLADGLGTAEQLSCWVPLLVGQLAENGSGEENRVGRAFYASRQGARRTELLQALDSAAAKAGWFLWERLAAFAAEVDGSWPLHEPEALMACALMTRLESKPQELAFGASVARCLAGAHPLWPFAPTEWALLQLWPTRRRIAGARLELAKAAGVEPSLFHPLVLALLREPEKDLSSARSLARCLARDLARDLERDLAHNLALDLARYFALYFSRNFARDLVRDWTRDWTRDLVRDWTRCFACDFIPDFARDLTRYLARDFALYFARDLARDWARDSHVSATPQILDVFSFELRASGRAGGRALLAAAEEVPDDPRWRLMQEASRLSLKPDSSPSPFEESLENEDPHCGDPLWPALARHLARRALPGDRDLLEEAVRHPESRPEPLRSGLQFIARGDVILNDGSVKTLDQFCEELGLPILPLLDDMPDEIDLGPDWDKDLDEPPGNAAGTLRVDSQADLPP